jgi:hypothetical protein
VAVTADDMACIDAGWDLTRRPALLDPPHSAVDANMKDGQDWASQGAPFRPARITGYRWATIGSESSPAEGLHAAADH